MSKKDRRLFAWMSDEEVSACAKAKGVDVRVTNFASRLKAIRKLESRGWLGADLSDLSNIHFFKEAR